jgi:hypothetical protein
MMPSQHLDALYQEVLMFNKYHRLVQIVVIGCNEYLSRLQEKHNATGAWPDPSVLVL